MHNTSPINFNFPSNFKSVKSNYTKIHYDLRRSIEDYKDKEYSELIEERSHKYPMDYIVFNNTEYFCCEVCKGWFTEDETSQDYLEVCIQCNICSICGDETAQAQGCMYCRSCFISESKFYCSTDHWGEETSVENDCHCDFCNSQDAVEVLSEYHSDMYDFDNF